MYVPLNGRLWDIFANLSQSSQLQKCSVSKESYLYIILLVRSFFKEFERIGSMKCML
jgi:hypothetical protein